MDADFLAEVQRVYNVLDVIEFKEFDLDWSWLETWIKKHHKTQFALHDRFVIVHFDTDFYWNGHGVNLHNLMTVWRHYDLPFYTMILYTNHYGIRREIDEILKDQPQQDRPTIIETFINPGNYAPHGYKHLDNSVDQVQHKALCMMAGTPRSHRYAVYQHLKDLVPDDIDMTVRKPLST